jgi:drug/metabolite transporter (DMT)-like permease
VVAVALGIGTALCWGLADFLGGLSTRRLTLAAVLLVSQFTGLAAIAVVVAVGKLDEPAADLAPALVAGVCQLAGIAALYRALAIGTMSVISPVSASGAAALPVVVGVATGERPGALVFAGMAAALVGVTLASRTPDAPGCGAGSRQGLELAAVAALGFGGFYVGMDAAVDEVEPFWALLAARVSAGAALAAVLLVVRPRLEASAADLPSLALIGLLDVGANGCFALGVETGLVSVVSVLASLYPVGTVLLARALLAERLVAVQTVGVTLALTGVALIAAASA